MDSQSLINPDYSLLEGKKKQPSLFKGKVDASQNIDEITTSKQIKSLAQLNKNLAQVAQKFANRPELNGLFLISSVTNNVTQAIAPVLEAKENQLDKQGLGVALIRRLSEIVPDRFVGNSQEPFFWRDPNQKGKTYQFQVTGGLVNDKGKTKFTAKTLKAIAKGTASVSDLSTQSEVFKATSLDNRSWRIERCDFTRSQLMSLSQAQNLVEEEQKQENLLSAQSQNKQNIHLEI